jgi:glycerone phosphate O-acyltransferase/fatty acyl-CoA reductase
MFSQYSMSSIRGFAWFLHKIFRAIYEKVVVDKKAIMRLKNWDEKSNGSLILIPTHRSYIDFLILSYVFFGYGIKVPYIAAA